MRNDAATVPEYLKSLPPDRRRVVSEVRKVIRKHLPKGYREGMNWGMICYEIPLKRYPDTYNGQPLAYVALASQKQYCSLYLSCVYQDAASLKLLQDAFSKAGLKLNMGKSCIRFTGPSELPLDALGKIIGDISPDEFIRIYEAAKSTYVKKRK